MIKFIRVFLLVLIIIGLGLLLTQKMWVPKVVDMLLVSEGLTPSEQNIPTPEVPTLNEPETSVPKGETGVKDPVADTSLYAHKWSWTKTVYKNGEEVTPKKSGVFTLEFKKDKTFSASTDCNGVGGEYTTKDSKISFERMMSTMMYCEGSQESVFAEMLSKAESYRFTKAGELVLDLASGEGAVWFK